MMILLWIYLVGAVAFFIMAMLDYSIKMIWRVLGIAIIWPVMLVYFIYLLATKREK